MVVQRDAKHELTWYENNAKYDAMGAAEIPEYNHEWDGELERMNRGKVGRPYKYSDSMMACLALTKAMWGKSCQSKENERPTTPDTTSPRGAVVGIDGRRERCGGPLARDKT